MTNDELDYIADRISEALIKELDSKFQFGLPIDEYQDDEQGLLAELAQAMTQLDYNLQRENYAKCEELQKKIIKIENKLNKFK
tara:strand:+ start:363 stop:611 length:249 start_codon:yes stop_codon:yes gene_type:complete